MANDGQWKALVASKQLEIDKLKRKIKEMEQEDGLRSSKDRKKNKRSEQSNSSDKWFIYLWIFYGNYPELVKVLEAAKDHCKAELKKSKERLESINYPSHDEGAEAVIQQYMQKGT